MDLPASTLKAQLDAAYVALDVLCLDRQKKLGELRAEADQLRAAYRGLVGPFADLFVKHEMLRTQIAQQQQALLVEREALLMEIQQIHASSSWRFTRPLRETARAVHWLRRQSGYAARAAWRVPRNVLRDVVRASVNNGLDAATFASGWWRANVGRPRTMWGVTPILTLPLLARCDRLLGLRSDSLVYTTYYTSSSFDVNLKPVREYVYGKHPRWAARMHRAFLRIALMRYDVFHLFCDQGILTPSRRLQINEDELLAIRRYGRRLFTYAYGADVRTRNTTLGLGRYNICAECPEAMKFCICDDDEGRRNMARIRASATAMVAMGDMLAYVPGARNLHYWPIDTVAVRHVGVVWNKDRPLRIGHAPNHPYFKGTRHLVAAVEKLRAEGRRIELVRVEGVQNRRVMALFASCDLVADQFIAGFHGYTALEAMALGKPVLCYLRNPEMTIDAVNCPIINAWPDTICDVLLDCLNGRHDLEALGRRSRAYIEHYYSLEAVALRLGRLYLAEARFNPRVSRRIARRMAVLERNLPSTIAAAPPVPWEAAMAIDGTGERTSAMASGGGIRGRQAASVAEQ